MDINSFITSKYEIMDIWWIGKNKANSKPNKANFKKAKMNVNSLITNDYIKYDDFAVKKKQSQNKANLIKSQNGRKHLFNKGL